MKTQQQLRAWILEGMPVPGEGRGLQEKYGEYAGFSLWVDWRGTDREPWLISKCRACGLRRHGDVIPIWWARVGSPGWQRQKDYEEQRTESAVEKSCEWMAEHAADFHEVNDRDSGWFFGGEEGVDELAICGWLSVIFHPSDSGGVLSHWVRPEGEKSGGIYMNTEHE